MNDCNLSLSANINLKEQPNTLYVHGSIMVYSANDRVVIKKQDPQGINPRIIILNLEIIEIRGPMKGQPRHFSYEEHVSSGLYDQVQVIYGNEENCTVDIDTFG